MERGKSNYITPSRMGDDFACLPDDGAAGITDLSPSRPLQPAEPSMSPLLLSLALLAPTQQPQPNANEVGVLPVGADGKPLNLDFETGTLRDWTAEGATFQDQPIKGEDRT